MAVQCPSGHRVRGGARFCPECGLSLEDQANSIDETGKESATQADRSGRRWLKPVIGGTVLVVIAIIAAAVLASGGNKATKNSATSSTPKNQPAKGCSTYTGAKPATCIASTGIACSAYGDTKPNSCYTATQLRARREHARIAAAKAKAAAIARAKAEAIAKKTAAAAAAAHAAYVAAANAWHKGYYQQDDNVFWKWDNSASCSTDYVGNGCWHIAVITRDGCPSYVAVNANEYQGSTIIGQLLANQGYGIPPRTVRIFELDADTAGTLTANNVSIDCN
jgi:hypothetical protein